MLMRFILIRMFVAFITSNVSYLIQVCNIRFLTG